MATQDFKLLPNERSEGEQFVEQYFKDREIRYITNYKLDRLKGDNKEYRLSDFYLPKFKIHVEFFGMWMYLKITKSAIAKRNGLFV